MNGFPVDGDRRNGVEPSWRTHLNHWLAVAILTTLGLLLAEAPFFPRARDAVYLWLQQRVRGAQKRVIVIAIDDNEFWRGPFHHTRPLDRKELAAVVTKVAAASPDVIGLDVGLETPAPVNVSEDAPLLGQTLALLRAIEDAGRRCPIVVSKTIAGEKPPFEPKHDVYEPYGFDPSAEITLGHTSAAADVRQIPTRVPVRGRGLLDSFALAIARASSNNDLPDAYEDQQHAWPFAFFLQTRGFRPKDAPANRYDFLTTGTVRSADVRTLRRWLRGQIVLIGGTWHEAPDRGNFVDARDTPVGPLPGVLMHANYVQSLLWGAMFPMPESGRIAIEMILAAGVAMIFYLAKGWRRVVLVVLTMTTVVLVTWIFSAAIGIFFDMLLPVTFLGLHAVAEEVGEHVHVDIRRDRLTSGLAVIAGVLAALMVVDEWQRVQHQLTTERRLQVSSFLPLPLDQNKERARVVLAQMESRVTTNQIATKNTPAARLLALRYELASEEAQLDQIRNAVYGKGAPPATSVLYLKRRASYEIVKENYTRALAQYEQELGRSSLPPSTPSERQAATPN